MRQPRIVPRLIYPVVLEMDPAVAPEPLFFEDWAELSQEERPRPIVVDERGLSRPLDPRGLPGGALFVGTGEKLLRHLDTVLQLAQDTVLRFEDHDAWRWQQRELSRMAAGFFGPCSRRPCLARIHQVAWTRSFGHRAIFGGDVSAIEENRTVEDLVPGDPLRLSFAWDDTGGIQVDGARLLWVDPMDVDPDSLRFGLLKESPDIHMPIDVVNTLHRQRVAKNGPGDVTRHGVFPATAQRLRAASRPRRAGTAVLEEAAVLDAQVIKFQRLEEPSSRGVIVMDELAIAFERYTGRVLEVSSEREPSGPSYAENFELGAVGRWLGAHL